MGTRLNIKLDGEVLAPCLPEMSPLEKRILSLRPETGGAEALSQPVGKTWCGTASTLCEVDSMPSEQHQKVPWVQFFADPSQWWDDRWTKPNSQHPDCRHVDSKIALWLRKRPKPAGVDTELPRWDASRSSSGALLANEVRLELRNCRKLCDDGHIPDAVDALELLVQRGCHVPNNLFYRALRGCTRDKDLVLGRRIRALSVKSGYAGDSFLAAHLIGMFASHGRLDEAMLVFSEVSTPNVYNWTAIIFACARHGAAPQAIELYQRMRDSSTVIPDDRIHLAVVKACAAAGDLTAGKEVHAHILASSREPDIFVQIGLVDMYAKCGSIEDARRVFDNLPEKTVVAWTAMFAGYAQQGMGKKALRLYSSMKQEGHAAPDSVAYVCLLQACANVGVGALEEGKLLHVEIKERRFQEDVVVGGSLVNMYVKCGSLQDARKLFDILPRKNVVSWNAMLAGYAKQGKGLEALRLFSSMKQAGLTSPDSVTYVCLLQACANVGAGAIDKGKQLHAQIVSAGLLDDVIIGGSLVNMYAKCGSLEDARQVFDRLQERTPVAWTAMLAGYAQQGMGHEALSLFSSMKQVGLTPPDSVTYVCLLQACASVGVGALDDGKQLHAQIREQGLEDDVVLGACLVNMYVKCGRLGDAHQLFDRLPEKSLVSWNAMLTGYVQQGMGQDALRLFSNMKQMGLSSPDSVTYVCLLQACADLGVAALDEGKQLHAQIKERGLEENVVLGASLVSMYAKCGSLVHAQELFDRLPEKNVVSWNAILGGYAQQGMGQKALRLYSSMTQEGLVTADSVTYVCLLQACASVGVGSVDVGKQVHAQVRKQGLEGDTALGSCLVNMYSKCGSLEDALHVFHRLPEKSVVAWNAMLSGYVQQGMGQEALKLFRSMPKTGLTAPDSVTYVCLLQACASIGIEALADGKLLHAWIKKKGLQEHVVVGGSLVNMYAKCGSLEDARQLFEELQEKTVVAWTAMLAGYAQQGMGEEALNLYTCLKQEGVSAPDSVTYACLLQACAGLGVGALDEGRQLHVEIKGRELQNDVSVASSLVNMYAKCGCMEDARRLFDQLSEKSVVAWTAMFAGYVQQGMGRDALDLYSIMQQEGLATPNSVTYVCLLQACANIGVEALDQGRQLHAEIKEQGMQEDVVLGGSLVNMYVKCCSLEDAHQSFDTLPEKNAIAWNALLAGYAKQGLGQEAFRLFSNMKEEGLTPPDSVTYVCLIQACAAVAALPMGVQLHEEIQERGMQADVIVGEALVNMYAKCGSMNDSQRVFDSLLTRSVESWNAVIGGYARQGDSDRVFNMLERMRRECVKADGMTFLNVLIVCSHVGLVDKGRKCFEAMWTDYGISATLEHFICMVDLFGRAGCLDEALQLVETMPFPPNDVVWHTLLGACQKWKSIEMAEKAFEGAQRLDEKDAVSYVLMSNIYASAQMWEAAEELQARRIKLGAWKKPGRSWWTDMGGGVHAFAPLDMTQAEDRG